MSGWLEVLGEKPPPGADGYYQRKPFIIAQFGCQPLTFASRYLGRDHRGTFPALARVCIDSPAYDSESLWLDDHEATTLLAEFQRLRRIAHWQEFLPGLDGRRFYDLWRDGDEPQRFEAWLDKIEESLARVGPGQWVHLSL